MVFNNFVLQCELAMVLYPVFVHMYLELVYNGHEEQGRSCMDQGKSANIVHVLPLDIVSHTIFCHFTNSVVIFGTFGMISVLLI